VKEITGRKFPVFHPTTWITNLLLGELCPLDEVALFVCGGVVIVDREECAEPRETLGGWSCFYGFFLGGQRRRGEPPPVSFIRAL
jgi:hypothetical protein